MRTLMILCAVGLLGACARSADFDVLLYRDAPNPEGIPTNWVAKVQPAGKSQPPAPWLRMTEAELAAHKAAARAAYEAWASARDSAEDSAESTRKRDDADTRATLKAALANWDTLNAAQQKAVLRAVLTLLLRDDVK